MEKETKIQQKRRSSREESRGKRVDLKSPLR